MNEKKQQILEVAIQCFAQKGCHETSIQEITDTLGIAKGSIYFYFDSKKDLFNSALHYLLDRVMQGFVSDEHQKQQTPRNRMYQQIIKQYETHMKYQSFMDVLIKEQVEFTAELAQKLATLKGRALHQTQLHIRELYGDEVDPYALDAANLFIGITVYYLQVFQDRKQEQPDFHRVALFLLERLDDVVHGMVRKQQPPIFDSQMMDELLANGTLSLGKKEPDVFDEINSIRQLLESLDLPSEQQDEIRSSLLVLEEEARKADSRPVVIKGMTAFLRGFKIKELKPALANIEAFYK